MEKRGVSKEKSGKSRRERTPKMRHLLGCQLEKHNYHKVFLTVTKNIA